MATRSPSNPSTVLFFDRLSPARQGLVRLFQTLNFGRVEGLVIRGGEPVLAPEPAWTQEIKFAAAENGARPERAAANFPLKQQLVELFDLFDRLRDGTIAVVELRHGLPFRLMLQNVAV